MEADLQDFANLFASLDNYENEPVTYMHAIMEVVWCVEDAKAFMKWWSIQTNLWPD